MQSLSNRDVSTCTVEGRHPYRPFSPHRLRVSGITSSPDGVTIRVDDSNNQDHWMRIQIPHLALVRIVELAAGLDPAEVGSD